MAVTTMGSPGTVKEGRKGIYLSVFAVLLILAMFAYFGGWLY